MRHGSRHSLSLIGTLAIAAIVLVGCGASATSGSPSGSPGPTSEASASTAASPTASAGTSAGPSATVSVSPPPATPTAAPTATAAPSTAACVVPPQTGRLPSDRMVDVRLSSSATADLVTFVFGDMSLPEPPQGSSNGSLEAAVPPYTQAASGIEIDVMGEHVVQVRFSGMSLQNDVGELTYDGPLDMTAQGAAALRQVANYDMSEGIVGWYIGYDGDGCVTLSSDASSVTVAIDHPRG